MNNKEFCRILGITENQFYGKEVINKNIDFDCLDYIADIPEGFSPKIRGYLDIFRLKKIPNGFNAEVSGYLNMQSILELPDNFSAIVGTNLWLSSVSKLPDNFRVDVGGILGFNALLKLPNVFNPIVGNRIYFNESIQGGDLKCEDSVKDTLRMMLGSDDKDIQNLAISMLWKYTIDDIKDITYNYDKIVFS